MRRVLVPLDISQPPRIPAAACVFALGGETMGTTWSVKLAAAAPPPAVARDIADVLDRVIAQMSTWRANSNIGQFNRSAAGAWHDLPNEFADVLDCALAIARDTDGAYDPTVGALVDLWGFGPAGPRGTIPPDDQIAAAIARTGWQRLRREGRFRIMQPGGLQLDLSSIAKGFAVDAVARCLDRSGVADYLVEIGGELRGRGVKPDGTPWWVALEQPQSTTAAETVVALHNLSIATSGDNRRFFECDGQRLSHTLDPRTGRPVRHFVASVTVLHRDCMPADAWATALMVLGPDAGFTLAVCRDLAARFVIRSGTGWQERMTPALAAMLD